MEKVRRFFKFISNHSKILGFLLSVLVFSWNLWVFIRQEQVQEKVNDLEQISKNKSSYAEPLILSFSFSENLTIFEHPIKELKITEIPKLKVRYYQGFPINIKSFYADSNGEFIMYTDVEYNMDNLLKEQEKRPTSELTLEIDPTYNVSDESERYLYSSSFYLFTDFTGKKQMYLVLYVVDRPNYGVETAKVVTGFIFDKDYILAESATDFSFMPGQVPSEGEKEIGIVVKKYLKVFNDLEQKLNTL